MYVMLFSFLKDAIVDFGQNKMDDCLAKCWEVQAQAMRHNSGNWPFLLTKAFYIISAVYRKAKEFDKADEYMERSSEVITLRIKLIYGKAFEKFVFLVKEIFQFNTRITPLNSRTQ